MKVTAVLVFLAAAVAYSSAALPVVHCSKDAMDINITEFHVLTNPECTTEPCNVKRGNNVSISITFNNTGSDINKLSNKVCGKLGPLCVPFPNYPPAEVEVCNLGTTKCPIKHNKMFTEMISLPISSSFPAMKVTAKWEFMNDETNKMAGCFMVLLNLT